MRKLFQPMAVAFAMAAIISSSREAAAQSFEFNVSMKNPQSHYLHVDMVCKDLKPGIIDFKIPVWTPGYYQLLNFHEQVENLSVTDNEGNVIEYANIQPNAWRIRTRTSTGYKVSYDIKTLRSFVATPYVDEKRAYISPPGVFLHVAGHLDKPAQVTITPYHAWNRVATGLDSISGKHFTYTAPNFDVLYDSPILVGNLEELKPFEVEGKLHRFIAHQPGKFNGDQLMDDLKKIVVESAKIIGDIPYKHYTFIAIGPGGGGIEHLNSTTISFSGASLEKPGAKLGVLHFLAHEYFHHYNVKRIRPIELGPFDYDKGSRTKSLWLSEGGSVYYEYLVVRRAGLSNDSQLLEALRSNLKGFANKPGRLHQSLAASSYETWSDGPFGATGDRADKTISYYQKGPIVTWMFDLAIRNATSNKKSFDDVMRTLYRKYYQEKKRGFTEAELRQEIETAAGTELPELFDYIYTTKEIDFNKYLGYAGLRVGPAKDFEIIKIENPSALQQQIYNSWTGM